jgi:hypothetical protein
VRLYRPTAWRKAVTGLEPSSYETEAEPAGCTSHWTRGPGPSTRPTGGRVICAGAPGPRAKTIRSRDAVEGRCRGTRHRRRRLVGESSVGTHVRGYINDAGDRSERRRPPIQRLPRGLSGRLGQSFWWSPRSLLTPRRNPPITRR